jgi:hypothetical protein
VPLWKPRACWLPLQAEIQPEHFSAELPIFGLDPATNKLKPATEFAKSLTEAADGITQLCMREKGNPLFLFFLFFFFFFFFYPMAPAE